MMVTLKGLPDALRGVVWPAPARAVKCPVNSGNERDSLSILLLAFRSQALLLDCRCKLEEGVGDARSVCPEILGLHTAYIGWDNEFQTRKGKVIC